MSAARMAKCIHSSPESPYTPQSTHRRAKRFAFAWLVMHRATRSHDISFFEIGPLAKRASFFGPGTMRVSYTGEDTYRFNQLSAVVLLKRKLPKGKLPDCWAIYFHR